jgi:uncharacterized membrane protein YgdD (TMEM256/DUF423 family)
MSVKMGVVISALFLAVAVAFGAFGAHALKGKMDAYYLAVYEKAVLYHFIHGLAALVISLFVFLKPEFSRLMWVVGLLLISTIVFSGSLYVLVLTGVKSWGAVTPIGGLGFIISWLLLAVFFLV